ncbi:type II secretion system F family protein [Thermomicrobium sp. 4228-Ro]|uniref:type II secretion system F family protein n=1 Tax=Thermomicrobium sp. 4228-Ro TaxID=2993937 RepID=UPI00224960CA|nr:type II secretion system F family protein [Thermomicrobium sp. 4228-Ro]MCX2727709.1 type II secretion system F family protein [Thermomicrobium sp. 4228-Ro]
MLQEPLVLMALFLAGAAAILLLAGLRTRTGDAAVERRLEQYAGEERLEPETAAGTNLVARRVDRAVRGRPFAEAMRTNLSRADLRLTVGEFLLLRFGTLIVGFALGFVAGRGLTRPVLGLFVGLLFAIAGWLLPHYYVLWRARRRLQQFINQLGDTIGLMANSLRAGYSLLQTMDLVARESSPPIADEFRRVVREVGLGVPLQEALEHMLRRVPSDDLDLLVTAIAINHEVGGNLAQILDVIGETIRERVRIKGEIRVLTAQQSLSGYVISLLPVGLAIVIFLLNPDYLGSLFTWPWICMPIGAVISMVIGFFVMRRIVAIEV